MGLSQRLKKGFLSDNLRVEESDRPKGSRVRVLIPAAEFYRYSAIHKHQSL